MIRYHDFDSIAEAEAFLADLRRYGGCGYVLTYNVTHHQVRELI